MRFEDRRDAGRRLAVALSERGCAPDPLVLALPRGGVPVAHEIARALDAELDVLVVRKLGVPWQPEVAMGAIAGEGVYVVHHDLVARLGIDEQALQTVVETERRELVRREAAYRGERAPPTMAGRCVILVDDGLATGATMQAAVEAVRGHAPARLVVAVPVAPADSLALIAKAADETVCLLQPESFMAVGQWYRRFDQTSDAEVLALLADCRRDA